MGDTTQTSTSTSGPTDPKVRQTLDQLLGGVQGVWKAGPQVYGHSLYSPAGAGTRDAWAKTNTFANGLIDGSGTAPGFASMREQALNDAVKNVGQGFLSSGRFGGGSYINDATKAAVDAIAPLDYQNYRQGIADKQTGLGLLGQVGAAQDANAQGALLGNANLWDAQHNGRLNLLGQLGSVLSGTAGAGGTTSTSSQPGTPVWQTLLGLGIGGLGLLG